MPTVLLITEQQRVRLLFAKLEQAGLFRLRVSPTLGQGEEEIALRLPHFVFAENHISGLTGSAIIQHLRSLLPEGAEVILMAPDLADSEQYRDVGGLLFLDLSLDDAALQRSISDIVSWSAPRQNPPPEPTLAILQTEPIPSAPGPSPAPKASSLGTSRAATSAKNLLLGEPAREEPVAKDRLHLWLIPLTLAIIALNVIAYRAWQEPTSSATRVPASVAPQPLGLGASRASVAVPASRQETRNRPAANGLAAPGSVGGATGENRRYVVQPGDYVVKILRRNFGFSYSEALEVMPELKRLNNSSNLEKLIPGQTLVIPAGKKPGKD